ncbi:MAG: S1 RNA-binding domain-containing protein [Candidatus Daviesbacteria bacterium]
MPTTTKPLTMDELMNSSLSKPKNFHRGDQVEGQIVAILDGEFLVDFGGKSEGIISKKDFPAAERESFKIGDNIKAFIASEGDLGQIILTLIKQLGRETGRSAVDNKRWQKFMQAQSTKSTLTGKVIEVNKGGLMVDIDGARGFVPSSQIGFKPIIDHIKEKGLEGLVGQQLSLTVIEADPGNNRLVFSARGQVSDDTRAKLEKIEIGQKVKGIIVAVAPFGLIVDIDGLPASLAERSEALRAGVEGIIYSQEVSWDEVTDLASQFEIGQEIESLVLSKDENLDRVNLSLRKLSHDPFEDLASKFEPDDVVKGVVSDITPGGVAIKLEKEVEGFIPTGSFEAGQYQIGQEESFLVDSIDQNKRRINLAPFITSTKGLIYK